MPSGTARIFMYRCPSCNHLNYSKCLRCGMIYKFDPQNAPGEKRIQRRIWFGERQWDQIKARAKVTPGVNSASELVRLACETILGIPPHWLISSD